MDTNRDIETKTVDPSEDPGIKVIKEGSIEIKFDSSRGVFYNPVQCFNRDLSVVMIRAWCEEYFIEKCGKLGRDCLIDGIKPINDDVKETSPNTSQTQQGSITNSHVEVISKNGTTEDAATKVDPSSTTDNFVDEQPLQLVDLSSYPYKNMSINIFEAMSATGLRALRYAKEIPNISKVIANDISPEACETINDNIKSNGMEGIVESRQSNATVALYESLRGNRYDVIDIDPYGSAIPFIDVAVQAVSNSGLLAVTCTDMAVLAGPYRASCWAKYGGITVPNMPYHHEMALRLVLNAIQTSALRYKRTAEPLACVSIDFYVRLFVRIRNLPKASCTSPENFSLVYHCSRCKSFSCRQMCKSKNKEGDTPAVETEFSSKCEICNSQRQLGGPFYSSNIHDKRIVRRAIKIAENSDLKTRVHILGVLNMLIKELEIPFYYSIPSLTSTIHVNQPQMKIFGSALLNSGYAVSISHCAPNCLKTNAPASFVWDLMRTWAKSSNSVSRKKQKDNSISSIILSKEIHHKVDMSFNSKINKITSRDPSYQSYRINPEKYWGPMARPKKLLKTLPKKNANNSS